MALELSVEVQPVGHELTPEEEEKLAHRAFELERLIKERVETGRQAWWELAEVLYVFHEEEGWRRLNYDSLEDFLQQPEIGMRRSTFFNAVHLWRDLVIVKQLPRETLTPLEPSKVTEVRPAIMAGNVKPEAAFADCTELSKSDVIEKYRPSAIARHKQQPNGSTKLDASAEPERVRCPCCRSWTTEDQLNKSVLKAPPSSNSN